MPTFERVDDLEEFNVPWGRVVRLQEVEYQGGTLMIRVRIREGRRITDLELSPAVARHLAGALTVWADSADPT